MELFAAEAGNEGEAVVLLHGFAGSHHVWRSVVPLLASDFRVIAYDLPGHGHSLSWPDAGPVKVAARAVLADLERRGIDRARFAGHSMGGAAAALAAIFEPSRVSSLTLLAPGGFGPDINARLLRRLASVRDAETLRILYEGMFGWASEVPGEMLNAALEMHARTGQSAMLEHIAGIIATGGVQGQIARPALEALPMPMNVLWARRDNILPLPQILPANARLTILDGVGHMLPEEVPHAVAGMIRHDLFIPAP